MARPGRMQMADQPVKPPSEPSGGFVARLVPDPSSPPDLKLLVGYPGDAAEKGSVRLYASPDLSAWWDIPESDVAQRQPLPGDPLGAEILWVRSEAQPSYQQRRPDSVNETGYPTIPPVTLFCTHPTYPTVHTYPTIPPVTLHYCTYATPQVQGTVASPFPNCGTSPVAGGAGYAVPPPSPAGPQANFTTTLPTHTPFCPTHAMQCITVGPVQTPQAQGQPVNTQVTTHWPHCPTPVAQGQAYTPPTTFRTWAQPQTFACTTTPVGQQAQAVFPTQNCTILPHTFGFTCTYVPPCW